MTIGPVYVLATDVLSAVLTKQVLGSPTCTLALGEHYSHGTRKTLTYTVSIIYTLERQSSGILLLLLIETTSNVPCKVLFPSSSNSATNLCDTRFDTQEKA